MIPLIFPFIVQDSGVQAVLGFNPTRFYPFAEAPQDVVVPYAVWQTTAGTPENYLGNRPDMDGFSVQIDVYAETSSSAEQVAVAIRDAIEGRCHITRYGGTTRDADTRDYRISFDITWFDERNTV